MNLFICPVEGNVKSTRHKTTEQFISEAHAKHGDKYSYQDVEYVNSNTKVKIHCRKCENIFLQKPYCHLSGRGCAVCAGNAKKSTEQFITEAKTIHGGKYGYDHVEYVSSSTKVKIHCRKCENIFLQRPKNHLYGYGCGVCGDMTKSTEQFISEAQIVHGDKYSYDQVEYVNWKTNVKIFCRKCEKYFQQKPHNHISEQKSGCPHCTHHVSKPETQWLDILGISERNQSIRMYNGKKINVDGYDPVTKTIYQFHGDFWHGNPNRFPAEEINPRAKKTFGELYDRTIANDQLIRDSGYKLVTIWESEFNDLYKDIIPDLSTEINDPWDNLFRED